MSVKPFARQGNYTQIDNSVLDHLMSELSGNQLKILLAIIRHTVGWRREQCGISIRAFRELTGIASHETISKALAHLVEVGLIIREEDGQRVFYALNRDYEMPTVTETVTATVTETVTPTVTETVTPTVTETVTASYIEKKEKEREKARARARPHPEAPVAETSDEVELVSHPATAVWLEAGFDWPGFSVLPEITGRLGREPDQDALIRARRLWQASGYRSGNVLGILDWYDELRADPAWMPGPPSRNGHKRPSAKERQPTIAGSW